MAQQGKQMRVVVCEGFPNHSLKRVSQANGNRYEFDWNTFSFSVVKPFIHSKLEN
jgi:hypothetical protein